eukprot:PhF_6_TR5501/c0_g1_i4/m.7780
MMMILPLTTVVQTMMTLLHLNLLHPPTKASQKQRSQHLLNPNARQQHERRLGSKHRVTRRHPPRSSVFATMNPLPVARKTKNSTFWSSPSVKTTSATTI